MLFNVCFCMPSWSLSWKRLFYIYYTKHIHQTNNDHVSHARHVILKFHPGKIPGYCQIMILAPAYSARYAALQKPHVCHLWMCVVLVTKIGLSTIIPRLSATQMHPYVSLRKLICTQLQREHTLFTPKYNYNLYVIHNNE
jgi:hypothetical protein